MKAICNDTELPGDPIPGSRPIASEVVKWNYTPQHHAAIYQFQLWAEYKRNDTENLMGEKCTSNTVISGDFI